MKKMLSRSIIVLMALCVASFGFLAPASASGAEGRHGVGEMTISTAPVSMAAAATTKVCAPKKCVTVSTSKICPPSKASCVSGKWAAVTGYCSPSVGCVTIGGKNYRWQGKNMPSVNSEKLLVCYASLGIGGASVYASAGILSWGGLALSAWGCKL